MKYLRNILLIVLLGHQIQCFFPFDIFKKRDHKLRNKNTESPIIGIISVQDYRWHRKNKYFAFAYNSYIAESYVQLVQLAGATPVFVEFDLPLDKLDWLLENIEGLIIPGADAFSFGFPEQPNILQKRIMWMVEKVKAINDKGKYFPVFSECFGFQAIIRGLSDYQKGVIAEDLNNTANQGILEKTEEFDNSQLWNKIDPELTEQVWNSGFLAFSHNKGLYPADFVKVKRLREELRVTATSISRNGRRFIA